MYPLFARPSILLVRAATWLFLSGTAIATAQPAPDGFKTFDNSIVHVETAQAVATVAALSKETEQRKLELHFALTSDNLQELKQRVAKGETVSPSEMKERYSGNQASFDALVAWLKSHGFTITHTSADRANVYAKASVAQIADSLGVKMATVTYKGRTGPAATTPPKLPINVGENVIAIDGLQPFIRAVKHTVTREEYAATQGKGKHPPVPRRNASTQSTYKVQEILNAYDADGLAATGAGQVIAILIDTFPLSSDLRRFWQANNLTIPSGQVEFINVQGKGTPLPPREGEETLDTEWATGIAPGARVRVYASGSLEYTYLDRSLDMIYEDAQTTPGMRQVSISLGLREDLVSSGELQIEQAAFTKLAAIGVSAFVSSGDAGSNPDATGHGLGPDAVVEYEASDAATIAVGGTTLNLDRASGKVLGEIGWSGSGGGVSTVFPRPAWQGAYAGITSGQRLVPDVSCVADPEPGAFVIRNGKEWPVGGTSWSAPVWAGFAALIADARQRTHKQPSGFLAPPLYAAASKGAFRDITAGSNGKYAAGPGWDPVTGLGVPSVKALLLALP